MTWPMLLIVPSFPMLFCFFVLFFSPLDFLIWFIHPVRNPSSPALSSTSPRRCERVNYPWSGLCPPVVGTSTPQRTPRNCCTTRRPWWMATRSSSAWRRPGASCPFLSSPSSTISTGEHTRGQCCDVIWFDLIIATSNCVRLGVRRRRVWKKKWNTHIVNFLPAEKKCECKSLNKVTISPAVTCKPVS